MKILNLIKASKALQCVLVGTVTTGAVVGGVVVYNNIGKQPEPKNNQEISEPVKELTEKDQSATELVLKDYEVELNTTEEDLNNINWLDFVQNVDELTDKDKTAFYGIDFEEVKGDKAGTYEYHIRYDDKVFTGKIIVKEKEEVKEDNKQTTEKKKSSTKSNNSNTNTNTNNNTSVNKTQTNTRNTSSNLLPVGKTYSLTSNGGKITILDGNKARLDMFGNSWTTDIKFDGNQYKFAFKKKNGSGSPTYFVNDNVLPILTYTFMKGEENKNTIDAREIKYAKSFSGAMRSDFSGFSWNGTYSCKTNEDIGNDCLLWAQQSYIGQPKNGHIVLYDLIWVLDNNFDILGFVLLQSTDGNIIQLYK